MKRSRLSLTAAILAVLAALVFGIAPAVLLSRARTLRARDESTSRKTGKPMEDALPAVLARIAAHSPWARTAHREEAVFWLAFARSGERAEVRMGPTRRLSRRIARAYSDAIRADAAFAAPRAVPALDRRSRFDLAGRKRGKALEVELARELAVARTLSGVAPGACADGRDAAWQRFAGARLDAAGPSALASMRPALERAIRGHDEEALAAIAAGERGARTAASRVAAGLVFLRRGKSADAEVALGEALARTDVEPVRVTAMAARALARFGTGHPDDAFMAIGAEGRPAFALVRVVASFVTGDLAGARVGLRRIPPASALGPLGRALEPGLVEWSGERRSTGRAALARVVTTRPDDWDFLVPMGRYAAGHLDDLDAWIELSAPRDGLTRVWQLYALERAARERGNEERAEEMAALRRRICRPG